MRVMLNTYPTAFALPGGGERQILSIYSELPAHGIQPMLYDLWQPRFDEADIVHFFSVVSGSLQFCNFVKDHGIPLVVSPNLWIDENNIGECSVDEIAYQLQLADAIVVNSSIEAESYKNILNIPDNKINVVTAGIPGSFMEDVDPDLAINTLGIKRKFVLCVGSLHPHKNQLTLIRAIKKFPDIQLVLFGHIRDKEYADLCIQEGGDQVMYAGAVPHSAQLLKSAMSACLAFVLPSLVESPSVASLEAAAQGAQMILTRIGSEEEYFGDLAHYIDPNDVDDVANALEKVLVNPVNGRDLKDLISSKFTVDSTCRELAQVYTKVLQVFNG